MDQHLLTGDYRQADDSTMKWHDPDVGRGTVGKDHL